MEGMSIHCMGVMERSSLESRESDPLGTLDWVVHSFLVILNSLLLYVLSFTSTGVEGGGGGGGGCAWFGFEWCVWEMFRH